jgi:murein DD-endopeptidase MepM/ murein hydrolase activator NlpD
MVLFYVLSFSQVIVLADSNGNNNASAVKPRTSQTLALLVGASSPDTNPGRGEGDIVVVEGQALVADGNPTDGEGGDIVGLKNQISLYVVRPGDTLSQVAGMFDVSVNTILWANDFSAQKGISPGQTLVILPVSGIKHVVRRGDTAQSIAKAYAGSIDEIKEFNQLTGSLSIGQEIIIPNGRIAVAATVKKQGSTGRVVSGISGPAAPAGYYIRPITGGVRTQGLHGYNGVDLANRTGTPIMASSAGTVVVAKMGGWNSGYGNYVVLSHDNGTQTLYAHASSLAVSVGETVAQGDVIAYVGSTGRSTGPHVHFEVRGAKNPF